MNTFFDYIRYSLSFFTRIPVGTIKNYDEKTLIASRIMLPFVGLIVGLLAAALFVAIFPYFPKPISILLVMTFLILITGAFHEDALADTVDAFGGGSTKEKILTIMKDSRIGTYGTLALILSFSAIFILLNETSNSLIPKILIFSQPISRFSGLFLMWRLPYVRHDSLFEKSFDTHRSTISGFRILLALIFTTIVGIMFFPNHFLYMILGVLIITLLAESYFKERIGGGTGDIFGATIKLSEIFIYFCGLFI